MTDMPPRFRNPGTKGRERGSKRAGPDAEAAEPGLMQSLLRPARRLVRRQLDFLERVLLREIKHVRADLQGEEPTGSDAGGSALKSDTAVSVVHSGGNLRELMRDLLERSTDQSQEECETEYFLSVLKTLVPDEARILSALSDGAAHPLIHVAAASLFGASTRQVVQNVSNIGKVAGVQWASETPTYVTRLRNLGLVETGPEEPSLLVKYQILETDSAITTAIERVKTAGRQKASIVRQSLKISRLGQALWDACHPAED
ncbi:MAG: Abi-alpha family protein [Stenotrophobium sp.]